MVESKFQAKIIKAIEAKGGVVVNGTYSKSGIADLICGYPKGVELINVPIDFPEQRIVQMKIRTVLLHLHIEVKTKNAYEALMRNNITEVDGYYVCKDGFVGREVLQSAKLNDVRRRGGLALFAYCIEQVEEYIDDL